MTWDWQSKIDERELCGAKVGEIIFGIYIWVYLQCNIPRVYVYKKLPSNESRPLIQLALQRFSKDFLQEFNLGFSVCNINALPLSKVAPPPSLGSQVRPFWSQIITPMTAIVKYITHPRHKVLENICSFIVDYKPDYHNIADIMLRLLWQYGLSWVVPAKKNKHQSTRQVSQQLCLKPPSRQQTSLEWPKSVAIYWLYNT